MKMNNNKYYLILFFLILKFCSLYSQTEIRGLIKDEKSNVLVNCNIVLKKYNEASTIDFAYSNEKGSYSIIINQMGKFTLSFSTLNYETQVYNIEINHKNQIIIKNVSLRIKPLELNEIIINSILPIIIKKDTIVFNADSFKQGDEEVVEDLLKKIPGLNIDVDGTIKVGNQEVEKVMIDGDDLFEKGYKILTKNMPVNPIDKIVLYQNYSKNKHLKGIENSNKVALNLTLKEDTKRVWSSFWKSISNSKQFNELWQQK
jgi:hypothetical protein